MVEKSLSTTCTNKQIHTSIVPPKKMGVSLSQKIAATVSSLWSRLTGSNETVKSAAPVVSSPVIALKDEPAATPKKSESKKEQAPKSNITRCFQWIKQGVQSIGSSISKTVSAHPYLTTALVAAAVYGAYRCGKKIELPKDLDEGVMKDQFLGASAIRDQIMVLETHDDSMAVALQTNDEEAFLAESMLNCYANPQNIFPNQGETAVWNTSTESMGGAEFELDAAENAMGSSLLGHERDFKTATLLKGLADAGKAAYDAELKDVENLNDAIKDADYARHLARFSPENMIQKPQPRFSVQANKNDKQTEFGKQVALVQIREDARLRNPDHPFIKSNQGIRTASDYLADYRKALVVDSQEKALDSAALKEATAPSRQHWQALAQAQDEADLVIDQHNATTFLKGVAEAGKTAEFVQAVSDEGALKSAMNTEEGRLKSHHQWVLDEKRIELEQLDISKRQQARWEKAQKDGVNLVAERAEQEKLAAIKTERNGQIAANLAKIADHFQGAQAVAANSEPRVIGSGLVPALTFDPNAANAQSRSSASPNKRRLI